MKKHLDLIKSLINKIEQDLTYNANINELSKELEISPWHFQRLFKGIVGDSLGRYIRGRRLSIAAELLLNTKKTIIEIAITVGFNSHESFTRSFKANFNYTPNEFRKYKPKVLINKKPVLNTNLLKHLTIGMDLSPQIIETPEVKIVGFETMIPSPFIATEPVCNFVGETWFNLFRRQNEIRFSDKSKLYALTISPSGIYNEESLQYLAGIPVLQIDNIPNGMTTFTIPRQKAAVFEIKTNVETEMAKNTIDYIYGYWMYKSGYERGVGIDYELFTDLINPINGDFKSKYVIPIK